MNDFTFQNTTKVYFGKNQLSNLSKEVKKYGNRILIVYGGGSIKRMGLYDKVMNELTSHDIEVFELSGVEPNPRHTTVNKGAALCKEKDIQVVLGIGGGSCIDCAKGIAAAAVYEGDNCWDLVERKQPIEEALAVFAMPTAASTGSEMDKSCVISNMDLNLKIGYNGEAIRPKVSFLDPTNTFTVSKYQTACGGFDIMCHFFDLNYFTKDEKYELQNGVVESLLRTVYHNIPIALEKPDDYSARANLLWAASWALNSFCTSGMRQAASCHSMEHELSAYYDLTHGLGLAILVPRWMQYLHDRDETVHEDFNTFGVNVLGLAPSATIKEGSQKAIDTLSDYVYKTLGLKSTLTECGIDDSKFEEMAANCTHGNVINGYRPLTKEDVVNIYRMCL